MTKTKWSDGNVNQQVSNSTQSNGLCRQTTMALTGRSQMTKSVLSWVNICFLDFFFHLTFFIHSSPTERGSAGQHVYFPHCRLISSNYSFQSVLFFQNIYREIAAIWHGRLLGLFYNSPHATRYQFICS